MFNTDVFWLQLVIATQMAIFSMWGHKQNRDVSTTEDIAFPFFRMISLSEVLLKGFAWKQRRHGRLILPCTPTETPETGWNNSNWFEWRTWRWFTTFQISPLCPKCFYSWTQRKPHGEEESLLLAASITLVQQPPRSGRRVERAKCIVALCELH